MNEARPATVAHPCRLKLDAVARTVYAIGADSGVEAFRLAGGLSSAGRQDTRFGPAGADAEACPFAELVPLS